jgi:hypothetical protein
MIIITQILRVIRVTIILVASFSSNQNHYNKMKTKAYNTVGTIQESIIITHILVVGFATTSTISVNHHKCCEFELRSLRGVFDNTM